MPLDFALRPLSFLLSSKLLSALILPASNLLSGIAAMPSSVVDEASFVTDYASSVANQASSSTEARSCRPWPSFLPDRNPNTPSVTALRLPPAASGLHCIDQSTKDQCGRPLGKLGIYLRECPHEIVACSVGADRRVALAVAANGLVFTDQLNAVAH